MTELRLIFVLGFILLLPGWAILTLTQTWSNWRGLQRYILAISLGITVYPIFFYCQRLLLPSFTLGPYKVALILFVCLVIILRNPASFRAVRLQNTEWFAVGFIVLTLLTRWWVAYTHPYPAWTDSVHHVMLTKLIAVQGQLPATLEPYYPVSLNMYHLGLHTIAAVVAWIAQAPFHTALLWTAQTLNGLCGLGVYLVLDRKVGRLAAIVGVAVVGLFSFQPAFYVNWGRFTQVASQSILLVAWLVTYETVQVSGTSLGLKWQRQLLGPIILGGLLTSGVYLLHYRVAAIYLLLLMPSLLYLFWQRWRMKKSLWQPLLGMSAIAMLALFLILPALLPALNTYIELRTRNTVGVLRQVSSSMRNDDYYVTTVETVLFLTGQSWFLWIALLAAVIVVARRSPIGLLGILWIGLLCLMGNTYRLGIPLLNVINLTGIVIMLYLPLSLIIGSAVQSVAAWLPKQQTVRFTNLCLVALFLLAIPMGWQRTQALEPFRFFVTEGDVRAMDWIRSHTPMDARFAVNTDFWNASQPHGTDAGYWIPYFTDRKVTASAMLLSLAAPTYQQETVELSRLVQQLNDKPEVIEQLFAHGVGYIYGKEEANYTGKGFDVNRLKQDKRLQTVYMQDGVIIFQIVPGL